MTEEKKETLTKEVNRQMRIILKGALIGGGVGKHLLVAQRVSPLGFSGGVSDSCRKITNDNFNLMPQILHLLQLAQNNCMPQMDIRRSGVQPQLYMQGLIFPYGFTEAAGPAGRMERRLKTEIFNLRIWAYSRMGKAHAGKAWV